MLRRPQHWSRSPVSIAIDGCHGSRLAGDVEDPNNRAQFKAGDRYLRTGRVFRKAHKELVSDNFKEKWPVPSVEWSLSAIKL